MADDVRLRAAQDGDEDVLFRAFTDFEVWEQRSPRPPRPVTLEAFRAQAAERASDGSAAEFVIEAAGRPVGGCSLSAADPLAHHSEVGISLVAEARGQGIGTAALRRLVDFGFERWNLHRVHLTVLASNAPARAAYLKVGFVEEGVLREHAWVRGRWDDEVRMGVLRTDWRAARS